MQSLYLPPERNKVIDAVFGSGGLARFWEDRFLPRWLPLLLALGLGLVAGFLIAHGSWFLLLPLIVALPGAILLVRYPFAAILVWTLIVPYLLSAPWPGGGLIFWLLHRIMIPAALILTAISGWQGIPGRRAVRLGWPELAMLIFAGLALTNIVTLNPDPVDTVRELYDEVIIPFCVYLLIRLTSPDEKDYKRFLWVAFVTLLIQCTIGIVGWFAPSAVPQQWTLGGERTVGSLLNADVYSSTILFLALLLLHFGLQQRSRLVRDATVSLFGLALFCVFISFSRSSWVGGLALVAGITLLYPKAVVRLLIVLTVSVLILGNTLFADEFAFAQQRLTSAESQRSANNRVISNNTSLLMLQAKPLFGWGYNTYEKNMQPFVTRVGDVPAVLGYNVASHNTYLTILVELGAIAFLFYMFPVFWWFIQSFRVRKRLPLDGFMSRRLLGVLWLLVLQMFVVSNFLDVIRFFPFGTTLWWLALGMIASLVTSHANPSSYPQK